MCVPNIPHDSACSLTCSRQLTSDDEDEVLGCIGIVGVPDDVHPLVLLLHVLQHQVAQRVETAPWIHLARSQQNHLSRAIGPGFEHNLSTVPGQDIDVNVLPEEGGLVLLFD